MSDDFESTRVTTDSRIVTVTPRERMAAHWGLVLGAGIVILLLGVTLAAWPGETVTVVAYFLAFQLILAGSAQIFMAFITSEGARRWGVVLASVLSITVGVLFFFDPLQTLTFIGRAAGIGVLVIGAVDLLGALSTHARRHRTWQAVRGVLCVATGLFLVANPGWSLGAMAIIACVWLISYGFITIVAALMLRSEQNLNRA